MITSVFRVLLCVVFALLTCPCFQQLSACALHLSSERSQCSTPANCSTPQSLLTYSQQQKGSTNTTCRDTTPLRPCQLSIQQPIHGQQVLFKSNMNVRRLKFGLRFILLHKLLGKFTLTLP